MTQALLPGEVRGFVCLRLVAPVFLCLSSGVDTIWSQGAYVRARSRRPPAVRPRVSIHHSRPGSKAPASALRGGSPCATSGHGRRTRKAASARPAAGAGHTSYLVRGSPNWRRYPDRPRCSPESRPRPAPGKRPRLRLPHRPSGFGLRISFGTRTSEVGLGRRPPGRDPLRASGHEYHQDPRAEHLRLSNPRSSPPQFPGFGCHRQMRRSRMHQPICQEAKTENARRGWLFGFASRSKLQSASQPKVRCNSGVPSAWCRHN
jgi:hypothetical protein